MILQHLKVVSAFQCKRKTYVLTHVESLSVAPFQGMTDILLVGPFNIVLLSVSNMLQSAWHNYTSTIPLVVGQDVKVWSKKATVDKPILCQKLRTIPTAVRWSAYGVAAAAARP